VGQVDLVEEAGPIALNRRIVNRGRQRTQRLVYRVERLVCIMLVVRPLPLFVVDLGHHGLFGRLVLRYLDLTGAHDHFLQHPLSGHKRHYLRHRVSQLNHSQCFAVRVQFVGEFLDCQFIPVFVALHSLFMLEIRRKQGE
jgi:hypothetical protein